jgi:lysophospholipase L1-like esterase
LAEHVRSVSAEGALLKPELDIAAGPAPAGTQPRDVAMTRSFRLSAPARIRPPRRGRGRVLGAAVLCLAACVASTARADAGGAASTGSGALAVVSPTLPRSMTALGDAITTGYDACGRAGDCLSASWAVGAAATVVSHYERLVAINPSSPVRTTSHASAGARAADLVAQARTAVADRAEYVTVTVGTQDACAPTPAAMTPVGTFRSEVDLALRTLTSGLPHARILVASVPDLLGIWRAGRSQAPGAGGHASATACPSLLTNAGSDAPADVSRREQVEARVLAYNTALRDACAPLLNCGYDRGAVFAATVTPAELSPTDGFHLNSNGQRALAGILWDAGFFTGLP